MIVDKVNAFLNTQGKHIDEAILEGVSTLSRLAFSKQFGEREERTGALRLSSIGRCMRQQAYKLLDTKENGKAIDARSKMVFFMGDLTELAVVALAKAAGCEITGTGIMQLSIEIDGVTGHPDGLLHDSGKVYLLEVKSMSSFSFKDFERGVIDEGYRYQCNAYMHAMGITQCAIVALNKDAGVLAEQIIMKDPVITAEIQMRIARLKVVTPDTLPERPYKADPKGFLPWQCLYCSYWGTCWPTAEKVLVASRYKLKEKPNVPPTKTEDRVRTGNNR